MEYIDHLFRQFIREQQKQGQDIQQLRKAIRYYKVFRRLMPRVKIQSLNERTILDFYKRIGLIHTTKINKEKSSNYQSSAIITHSNVLGSFFNWLQKNNFILSNPFEKFLHQTKVQQKDIVDNPTTQADPRHQIKKIDKLKMHAAFRNKRPIFDNQNNEANKKENKRTTCINNAGPELLAKQLSRRFASFFQLTDPVFFRGTADYVKFIVHNSQLMGIIKKHVLSKEMEDYMELDKLMKKLKKSLTSKLGKLICLELRNLETARKNSEWGSWFNLELVYYLINNRKKELYNILKNSLDLIIDYCSCLEEMKIILSNGQKHKPINFKRNNYSLDMIRIHNYILDQLEITSDRQAINKNNYHDNKLNLTYIYNDYNVPTGELIIKGITLISFKRTPATVIQFFYINKAVKRYLNYHNFNEYRGPEQKQVRSNDFRLIIEGINNRIKAITSGLIKEIIIKRETDPDSKSINFYKWNEKYQN